MSSARSAIEVMVDAVSAVLDSEALLVVASIAATRSEVSILWMLGRGLGWCEEE